MVTRWQKNYFAYQGFVSVFKMFLGKTEKKGTQYKKIGHISDHFEHT
jgi:hypothetical protein